MSDNTMPERLWVERISYVDEVRYDGWEELEDGDTEYIRADVAQAQLDAANARIAELEAAQAWVSVDERLPDVGTKVVANRQNQTSVIVEVTSANWFKRMYTYWMPLPPPPVTDVTP